jgi:hypothetical protein
MEEPHSRFGLGLRGFGGGLFSDGERQAGGGGTLLMSYALVPERWELELGLSVLAGRESPLSPLGVFEIIGKRILERHGPWSPHLLLGPALSLNFGADFRASAGVLAGGGVTHWLDRRWGIVLEGAYRLLLGSEVESVLTLSLGINFRFM